MLSQIKISTNSKKLIVCLFLIVIAVSVFYQVIQYDFVILDDDVYVTDNLHVRSGLTLQGIRWAFTTTYAEFWHPLTWLSLMFDHQIYGLNAGGYHLTNLILHIMSTLFLFWLFNRMTGSIWRSAFIAAFFAFHPLRVESVAWVAERKDVLSAFFWMLTLCLYVYYTEKSGIKRYLMVLLCFIAGLMSKPMLVTLPVVMMLLDYWPLRRFSSEQGNVILWQFREKLPFFICSALFSLIAIYVQPEYALKDCQYPLESRIVNALASFVIYWQKTFWPVDLSICYSFYGKVPLWQLLGMISLIVAVTAAVISVVKRRPYFFVGWCWYALTILPVLGIIPVGNNAMADRYIYLPSIGMAIMLAWGMPSLFKKEGMEKKILFAAAIAMVMMLAILTWKQSHYWQNSIELFSRAMQITKDNPQAHDLFASALVEEGKIGEAVDHYSRAIHLQPDNGRTYYNRGVAYAKLGQYHLAVKDYDASIRLNPYYANAFNNRGNIYAMFSRHQYAINDFSEAIRLQPNEVTYYNRGNSYAELGLYDLAFEDFNTAIKMQPAYIQAYYKRGNTYVKVGQYEHALKDLNEAIRLKPDYFDAYYIRGAVYFYLGHNEPGCRDERKACDQGNCRILEFARGKGLCP